MDDFRYPCNKVNVSFCRDHELLDLHLLELTIDRTKNFLKAYSFILEIVQQFSRYQAHTKSYMLVQPGVE